MFENKKLLVTGGTGSIGGSICTYFSSNGCKEIYSTTTNMNKVNYENLSQTLSKVFFKKTSIIKINLGKEFLSGTFKKIDSSGQLVLTNDDKDFKLNYGEIIW